MYVTVLPISNPAYFCSPKSNTTTALDIAKRSLYLLSGFGLSINGKHVYCGDFIYSGHTVMLVLGYLIIVECKFTISSNYIIIFIIEAINSVFAIELNIIKFIQTKCNHQIKNACIWKIIFFTAVTMHQAKLANNKIDSITKRLNECYYHSGRPSTSDSGVMMIIGWRN